MVLSLHPTSYFMATSRLAGSLGFYERPKRLLPLTLIRDGHGILKPDSYRYRTMNGFKGSLIEVSKNLDKLKLFFTFLKDDPGTARKQLFHFRPCVVIYTKIPTGFQFRI